MLTWLAIKAAVCAGWTSFISWCKERWELLVGVVVGILGMLALSRNNQDIRDIFDKKNELNETLSGAEADARKKEDEALRRNIEKYLEANENAEAELEEKVSKLDANKRHAIEVLLSSDSPESEIAARLKEFLG